MANLLSLYKFNLDFFRVKNKTCITWVHFLTSILPCCLLQVLMVRFCSLFNHKERSVTFLNGQTYPLGTLRGLGMGSLLDAMFEFSSKLSSLDLESDEMALFMAVVLVSAGKSNTRVRLNIAVIATHTWF